MFRSLRNRLIRSRINSPLKSTKTPGVYVEEVSAFPPSVAQVETAIPAFIGYTEKASLKTDNDLTLKPRRIRSLLEYEQLFGGPASENNVKVKITTSATANFDQVVADLGERRKYLMFYALQLYFSNGGGPCYITSVGAYQSADIINLSALQDGLAAVAREDEVTLIVFPEGQNLSTQTDYHALQQASLAQCASLGDRFAVMDLYRSPDTAISDADLFRNGIGINNLKYAAAYYPNLETVLNFKFDPEDVTVEINGATSVTLTALEASNPAQFAQAITAIDQLANILPPSPAIVGVYTAVDASRGVWKAPANVSLNAVIKPTEKVSDHDQESFNVDVTAGKSINVIRNFVGRGTLVWGARTLAGNDSEWRYISVRRFCNMVEESTKKALAPFVFEPNDANTWTRVKSMIENFLALQWREGALMGTTPEQAFYVKVGENETMTTQDIREGRMIVTIGLAAIRPAEFIILQFTQKMAEA